MLLKVTITHTKTYIEVSETKLLTNEKKGVVILALELVVKEVERLSQEEGLNDREISIKLGCSRATVNRIRVGYEIPTANLSNRRDKKYICSKCGKEVFIRRRDRRKLYCTECSEAEK